jgi:DnaJ-class molecular chaperone
MTTIEQVPHVCPLCHGDGKDKQGEKCSACHGHRIVFGERTTFSPDTPTRKPKYPNSYPWISGR